MNNLLLDPFTAGVAEVRAFGKDYPQPLVGFFDNAKDLAKAIKQINGGRDIYIGLNPRRRELLERMPNRLGTLGRGEAGSEKDIVCRRWFLIDVDPERPTKQNATDEELAAGRTVARAIGEFLKSKGVPFAGALSGNGCHILIRLPDYPVSEETTRKHKLLLAWLARRFSDGKAKVDVSVHDAPRISRLYGTLNVKGDNLPDRPQRMAKLLTEKPPAAVDLFALLAAEIEEQRVFEMPRPAEVRHSKETLATFKGDLKTLDVVALFEKQGLYRRDLQGGKHSVSCPWASGHSTGDDKDSSTVVWEADGERWPSFHCSHSHCQGRNLNDVLASFGAASVDACCREAYRKMAGEKCEISKPPPDKPDKPDKLPLEWPEILPFGLASHPPSPPADSMPEELGRIARHIAEAVQVPAELPIAVMLGILGTAIGKRAAVQLKPGHREPSSIWTCCVLPPGSRKSAVVKLLKAPLEEREVELQEAWKAKHREWRARAEVAEESKKLALKGSRKLGADTKQAEAEILEANRIIEDEPKKPHLWTEDTTSEALRSLMAENGSMGILSAEGGGVLEGFGRYTGARGPEVALFLAGHAGDAGKATRKSGTVSNREQLLSMALAVQPDVLEAAGADRLSRERGLLDRFAWFIPRDPRGSRTYDGDNEISVAVLGEWAAIVRQILSMPAAEAPPVLKLSFDAQRIWRRFANDIEVRQGPDGDLNPLSGWASKLAGLAGRIALAYHLALGGAVDQPIGEESVSCALRLCTSLVDHFKAARAIMGDDATTAKAKTILGHIRRVGLTSIKPRDIVRKEWAGIQKTDEALAALRLLEDRGYLRESETAQKTGRPGVAFEISPSLSGLSGLSGHTIQKLNFEKHEPEAVRALGPSAEGVAAASTLPEGF